MAKKTQPTINQSLMYQVGALGSKPVIDYSAMFDPALVEANKMLNEAQVKSEKLINAMPAGVNISKVPEELRGQAVSYTHLTLPTIYSV